MPEGFAQGYQTLVDDCEVVYQMTHEYVPEAASGVRWDDPAFGIEWPARRASGLISERDLAWPDLRAGDRRAPRLNTRAAAYSRPLGRPVQFSGVFMSVWISACVSARL